MGLQLCLRLCDISIVSSSFGIEITIDEDLVLLNSCLIILIRGVQRVKNCCVDHEVRHELPLIHAQV